MADPPLRVFFDNSREYSLVEYYNPQTQRFERDRKSMVVYIDGGSRNNGKPSAKAGWGVYFGPGSFYNRSGLVDAELPQTNQRAEIEALSQALDTIWYIAENHCDKCRMNYIIINSDSTYVVDTISSWVKAWIRNRGMTSKGHRAAHYEKWKELDELLDSMLDTWGIHVEFRHVRRENNREADALVQRVLR
ncbi:ribonuclease H-like protein [Hypomontagnella submonticulosa]|nr:ribonuclease H-like protein [Hypomontagnella submonticulosa]